jgi:hypothetical protein
VNTLTSPNKGVQKTNKHALPYALLEATVGSEGTKQNK